MSLSTSVVIVSRNEGAELKATVSNLLATLPSRNMEIVVVDDGSTDGSTRFLKRERTVRVIRASGLGVAKARNLGASASNGDVILFSDAHMRLPKHWHRALIEPLRQRSVGAVGPGVYSLTEPRRQGFGLNLIGPQLHARWRHRSGNNPSPVPVLPGCFLAMRRETFDLTGGFDSGLRGLGGNDNELCIRLWLLGFDLLIVPAVRVGHLFRTTIPYPAKWSTVLHNRLRTAFVHFNEARVVRVVNALRGYDAFAEGLAQLFEADIAARRNLLHAQRRRSDDWFFKKFKLTC